MARTIILDAAGRLVIPIDLRRELGLKARTEIEVELEIDAGEIRLRPIRRTRLKERAGRLVLAPSANTESADHRKVREERLEHLAGPLKSSQSPIE